jgi:hypothetical protein
LTKRLKDYIRIHARAAWRLLLSSRTKDDERCCALVSQYHVALAGVLKYTERPNV